MKLSGYEAHTTILKELGERLKMYRVGLNITQKEMAEKSGLSVRTISNIESGCDVTVGSVLQYLTVVRLVGNIDHLIPESQLTPIDIMEGRTKRKRAGSKVESTWKWGDEL